MSHILRGTTVRTDDLLLRPWTVDDSPVASSIYGTRMRAVLEQWVEDTHASTPPIGRWAIERPRDQRVVGGASLLPLPPGNDDLGIAWRLDAALPQADHNHLGSAIVSVLAPWVFDHDVDEVFAVVAAGDAKTAADLRRSGLRWVGETSKYYGRDLQVFRLRRADLREADLVGRPGVGAAVAG